MRWPLVPLLGLALGCALPISTQLGAGEQPPKIERIAVEPFADDVSRGGAIEPGAAAIVTARVLDALTRETDLEVLPPGQSTHGVDAVLSGVVRRYVERVGGPGGAFKPASVSFTLELRTPEGELLWSGTFEETQRALSEDLGSLPRAWRRGFKWLTADELATEGAEELAIALAEDAASWS
jgi:hypothetical protein